MEKLFRPLPSGVQRLLLSSESWSERVDSTTGPWRDGGEDARPVPGGVAGPRQSGRIIRTPEEQVLALFEQNDGRMRRSEIAAEMDYSESTASRKLCALEEEAVVTRYLIGREKIVFLPDLVPAFLDSPLDRMEAD